jgi:hypothetical protein
LPSANETRKKKERQKKEEQFAPFYQSKVDKKIIFFANTKCDSFAYMIYEYIPNK